MQAAGVELKWGDGQRANHQFFQRGESVWQGASMHSNPEFYKYKWKIWTLNDLPKNCMSWDSNQQFWFESQTPKVSMAQAMETIKANYDADRTMLVRSHAYKRMGPKSPWSEKRVPVRYRAISLADDSDPKFFGHK